MPEMSRKHHCDEPGSTGFILLEALIAKGLITTSSMAANTLISLWFYSGVN